MKFTLDTNDYENIQLVLTDEDRAKCADELQEEFEYAMSSFFVSFCLKNNWDTETAKSMKQSIFTKIDRHIANMFAQGILEPQAETETVDEVYLEDIKKQMEESGFAPDEIQQMLKLVQEHGSIEKASAYLSDLAESEGVKINE
ncbi:MAG: hypothetical protein Q4D21_02910 [Phascolarctobacterium sp.]|nr:hypothetical protein [Phascolarctobacterium sp.]